MPDQPPEAPDIQYDKTQVAIKNMFCFVAKRYDLANRVMSLGRDPFWREALARRLKIVEKPGRLLDLAAGTGDQILAAKKLFPKLEVVGIDLAKPMLDLAEPKFYNLPDPKPKMMVGDALNLPFETESFDSVSISFGLRNIKNRPKVYEETLKVLKPGGRFLLLEMYFDKNSIWAGPVGFYLQNVIPFLGGRMVSQEAEAYRYLTKSIMGFPGPEKIVDELKVAGFAGVNFKTYTFNTVMLVWGDKAF